MIQQNYDDLPMSVDPSAWRSTIAELTRLRAEVERLTKERDHWKANHDHQVEVKRAIQDRPDLKERAASWAKLNAELTALRAVAEAAGLYVGTETSDVLDVRGSKKAFQELCTALAAWKSASKQEDKG